MCPDNYVMKDSNDNCKITLELKYIKWKGNDAETKNTHRYLKVSGLSRFSDSHCIYRF